MGRGRRAARRLGAVLLLTMLALGGVSVWAWRDYAAPGPLAAAKIIVIPKGERLLAIAGTLGEGGVIAHPYVFAAMTFVERRAGALHAGEYEFAAAISPRGVADLLESGRVVQHRLTIPEGLTSSEIVALVDAAPALEGELDFIPPEGTLLPDTYFYVLGTKRPDLVARISRAMNRALAEAWASRSSNLPLTSPAEALTLASIVEKETAKPEERARIAGVYIERLRLGMKLQADPTVVYALTRGGAVALTHPLDHDDLATPSPYNTYLEKGLPPTPIDNPGLAALNAAVVPDDRGELYFVADGSGGHNFARTLDEHNRNVAALRQKQGQPPADAARH
jgi:UPF0755 protein